MTITFPTAYQKMVNWEPLIELVAIHFKGEGGGKGRGRGGYICTVGEGIQAELVVKYSGPEVQCVHMHVVWSSCIRVNKQFSFQL